MNEVRSTQVTGISTSSSASLKNGHNVSKVTNDSNTGVEEVKQAESAAEASSTETAAKPAPVKDVVASMNDYVQSIERDLKFSVDEETEKTVIKVIDGGSGELIRQIPEETFLELARKLNEDGSFQLIDALG